jgi:hypothetical protein
MQLLNSIPIYLVPLNLPVVLRNENTATIVLYAVKSMMTVGDPAIVIQWNAPGFNDVPTTPGSRNGVAGQTRQAIVNHFTANRGTDVNGQNTIFVFRTNNDLGWCENNLPGWY